MELYKKFSNLFDVNIIKQLSSKDILISSSNQIKIYSIETFDRIYYFKEIESSIISIKSISEINSSKKNEIILAMSLSDFSIQIIKLTKRNSNAINTKNKSNSKYRHKLHQTLAFKKNKNIPCDICISSFLNYLIIGINNSVQYYINKGVDKLNFVKEKEYKINSKLKSKKPITEIVKGIRAVQYQNYNLILLVEEINFKEYDLKIHYFDTFELITHFRNLYIFPDKGLMSFMTCSDEKKLFLVIGDRNDGIMIIKLFDDFDIYEDINLSKIIKDLSYNKNNISFNYEIKSVCGLSDGSFVICLYYLEPLNEKNYMIRARINNKTKKLEVLYINENAHNNKTNFITSSIMATNNKKPEETFYVSGDHEGMIKFWKMKHI